MTRYDLTGFTQSFPTLRRLLDLLSKDNGWEIQELLGDLTRPENDQRDKECVRKPFMGKFIVPDEFSLLELEGQAHQLTFEEQDTLVTGDEADATFVIVLHDLHVLDYWIGLCFDGSFHDRVFE